MKIQGKHFGADCVEEIYKAILFRIGDYMVLTNSRCIRIENFQVGYYSNAIMHYYDSSGRENSLNIDRLSRCEFPEVEKMDDVSSW